MRICSSPATRPQSSRIVSRGLRSPIAAAICSISLPLKRLVGDFADHQLPLATAGAFDTRFAILGLLGFGMEAPADAEAAAPGFVGIGDCSSAFGDDPAGGEIGALEQFHQPRVFDMRIVDHLERGIDDLGDSL